MLGQGLSLAVSKAQWWTVELALCLVKVANFLQMLRCSCVSTLPGLVTDKVLGNVHTSEQALLLTFKVYFLV